MKKATSVVDERTGKRLAFAGMVASNVTVLPDSVIDEFSLNENREQIPDRLLFAFTRKEVPMEQPTIPVSNPPAPRFHITVLRETPKPCAERSADEQVEDMRMMYGMLGLEFTTSGLIIPKRRAGFDRLVIVGAKLSNNLAFEACEASFPSWRYVNNLNTEVPVKRNERHPAKNGLYAVWFRDRIEADEELKNFSADMIVKRGLKTITLLERELYELVYYMETGKHLDIANWTICSGSRDSGGGVPGADRYGDWFEVRCHSPGYRNPSLRSREAVSL